MTTNYRDTLNLPKTDFSMKAGLPGKSQIFLIFGKKQISTRKLDKNIKGRSFFTS